MKTFMMYYSFLVILAYFTYTLVKLVIANEEKDIIRQFIKALIMTPILVNLYFVK